MCELPEGSAFFTVVLLFHVRHVISVFPFSSNYVYYFPLMSQSQIYQGEEDDDR